MAHRTPKLTKAQKELIERFGVLCEQDGPSRVLARVMALLMVSPVVELPFDDIGSLLQLSKSATSSALNQLMALGKVEYVTHPGEHRRYFRIRLSSWRTDVLERLQGLGAMAEACKEVLAQRPGSTPEFNRNLEELTSFFDHMHREIPRLIAKWEKGR